MAAKKMISIDFLRFYNNNNESANISLDAGLNLIYGASNTGKSFTLKAIDFMMGGSQPLPDFQERQGYDKVALGITFNNEERYTLERSINGGDYKLYKDLIKLPTTDEPLTILAATSANKKQKSLSHFLLEKIGFLGKKIAKNNSGTTENLSFRDFSTLFIIDETSIQSERSPVESDLGKTARTKERSLFRLMITGSDDRELTSILDPKSLKLSKYARIDMLNDLLRDLDSKISDRIDLNYIQDRLNKINEIFETQKSVYSKFSEEYLIATEKKHTCLEEITEENECISEITIHLEKFSKLNEVYHSDILRLKALEEAGFILSIFTPLDCPLCGASSTNQKHKKHIESINSTKIAAIAETQKITNQKQELQPIIADLNNELTQRTKKRYNLEILRKDLESELERIEASFKAAQVSLSETLALRDKMQIDLSILHQKQSLEEKIRGVENEKYASQGSKPNLKVPIEPISRLCTIFSKVLLEWGFPGECNIAFDELSCDFIIDGKLRTNNGKGVRAVTHAAFNVALILFCEEYSLPHPGFLILDSPLVTYRDPIQGQISDAQSAEELAIKHSDLKEKFFIHLSSLRDIVQILVLENIDPPSNIEGLANVETFYGKGSLRRSGLFPE